MVKEHWATFPNRKSHYSHQKSERKFFDNPELNVTILYNLFKEYYAEKTGKALTMKYSTYHQFFRKNSEYLFRSPKSDICDFCTQCSVTLQTNPNVSCKLAYEEHLNEVKQYKELKKKVYF